LDALGFIIQDVWKSAKEKLLLIQRITSLSIDAELTEHYWDYDAWC